MQFRDQRFVLILVGHVLVVMKGMPLVVFDDSTLRDFGMLVVPTAPQQPMQRHRRRRQQE